MNSTGVVHRRGFAVLVLVAAVALAAYLLHARLGDGDAPYARTGAAAAAPAGNAPAAAPSESAGPAGGDYNAAPAPVAAPPPAGKVLTALTGKKVDKMGDVVLDNDGFTLYRFEDDKAQPPTSACVNDCATKWTPALKGNTDLTVTGMDAAAVGTLERPDGGKQITINGWAVYLFAADPGPGKWKGQGVANKWFVVQPNGTRNVSCLPPGAQAPAS